MLRRAIRINIYKKILLNATSDLFMFLYKQGLKKIRLFLFMKCLAAFSILLDSAL